VDEAGPPLIAPPLIAVTSGEPAGIGPDICLALQEASFPVRLVVLADKQILAHRAARLGHRAALSDFHPGASRAAAGTLEVLHVPAPAAARAGQLDATNSPYVLALLDRAADGCLAGEFAAMVTAPVQKSIINDAGIPFSGHTEYLAAKGGRHKVVMMLAGGGLRVALATTHLALADVPAAVTAPSLLETLRIVERDLRQRFGLARPRIAVAGLNPHAGEHGYLGREDDMVIAPVIAQLQAEGWAVSGPWPADTLFVPARLKDVDCVLAMYHDQGLPVLKYASFGGGVNITLGLPFIRTSVDHGTALDLAGTGKADPGSLIAAVNMAVEMITHKAA
jgi:4-hydroxythreonine-4-phosphate dehydrogenase